jgi:hypothetical protein
MPVKVGRGAADITREPLTREACPMTHPNGGPGRNLVVVRYLDGTVRKGSTSDFNAMRPSFHLQKDGGGFGDSVLIKDVKAVFFVKSLAGDPDRVDVRGFVQGPSEGAFGRKIAVRFTDGELLCGFATSFTPQRGAFFLVPADPRTNNLRVFVNVLATTDIEQGPAADHLAQRWLTDNAA